ncbi:peptidoglycan DD-metalloendopeptidase family protein [Lysobacter capsici]|uniref:peptidoglycan DD-metalloendopeptidase family protein n=1 Tax=Lysobacter capsici TaxID=435897 RepID=UPI00287B8D53|nr:peptidoglycan DD-metalloendopeptidase family protein [Lysobacter capsici]WND79670.1 peptidoglycan DD-metalloendopeptidase family protein [Lysobacter capsici]WND84866.1 peptidoglycan DD-metalloendopeptidase family protein [Lysobacter capsici]
MHRPISARRAPTPRGLLAGFAAAALGLFANNASAAKPNFQMPFACNQTWYGDTYPGHGLRYAVDLNHKPRPLSDGDLGSPVVASAGGKATTYNPHPGTGYGKLVVIDHGGGWTTWYAHLDSIAIANGASVNQGQKIGTLGKTTRPGNSISAHLHYEQRLNNDDQKIVWNGSTIVYDQYEVAYKSRNSCGTSPGGVAGTVRTAGSPLNVRSGPGTTYSIVGSRANGASVSIRCQKAGESISGTYGTSNIWNNIAPAGSNQYIPDAYTYTGSDGRVAPDC